MRLDNRVYAANDPIWSEIWPPNGWNCRCYITPLTLEEVQQTGTYVPPVESQHHRDEFIKTIPPEFRRNSAITGHIFDKWISEKLSGMPKPKAEEIRNRSTRYNETSQSTSGQPSKEEYKYHENLTGFDRGNFKGWELTYKEAELKDSNGNCTVNTADKTVKILVNKNAIDKPSTAKHETGHGIDHTNNTLSNSGEFANLTADRDMVIKIIDNRMFKSLNPTDYVRYERMTKAEKNKFINGHKVEIAGKTMQIPKEKVQYYFSRAEVFAEAYCQYQTIPEFRNYAKPFKEYFDKLIINKMSESNQNFTEMPEGQTKGIYKSYSFRELQDMFMEKYNIKNRDDIDGDKMCEWMDTIGYHV